MDILCLAPGQRARPRVREADCYEEEEEVRWARSPPQQRQQRPPPVRRGRCYRCDKPSTSTSTEASIPTASPPSPYQPFIWTEECAEAFARLRMSLTEVPVLAYPDVHRPFIVDTNASNVGVGDVLSQEDSDGERANCHTGVQPPWCLGPRPSTGNQPVQRHATSASYWNGYEWHTTSLARPRTPRDCDRSTQHCKGQAFKPGDRVWIHCPVRKKGLSPKLQSHWRGPGEVVGRLSEVTYRVRMPNLGRLVVLHQDRLAPYHPLATKDAAGGKEGSNRVPSTPPAAEEATQHTTGRPTRQRRFPNYLRNYEVNHLGTAGSSGTSDP
ncbi:hypothetical protein AAFF_G00327320 [Aldrovandia affinis]|uniref:Uncharacterized protein n=1 Tax=Aldrovandia affinis TaxID=143900 RepID=A0AAD7T9E8_9TELE|nr:hypothetical protein AAFF_G00327320 [Aldrovandia affinis]